MYTVDVHAVFFVLHLIVQIVLGEAQMIHFALLALIIGDRQSGTCTHGWPVNCLALARKRRFLV